MSSHLPKDHSYGKNEWSPEDNTECNTTADADEGDSINLSQYTEEHGDKYTPMFQTVPCDYSESDKYVGVFDFTNYSDDVNDSSTISDDECESGDVIESSNESSTFSDEESIALDENDSFHKTSNEVDGVYKSCSGIERKIYRYQTVQKRRRIRNTHESMVRQTNQEIKALRGNLKDIYKIVKAYFGSKHHDNNICKESLESKYIVQTSVDNAYVIGDLTSDLESIQGPYFDAFGNTKLPRDSSNNRMIPRNDVFSCFELIQFVLFQFQLEDELIKRPALDISCTLPYKRFASLSTPTTKENMRLHCLTEKKRAFTLMVKKQPCAIVQPWLSQAVQIGLTQDGTVMALTKRGMQLYTESKWQLPGCQITVFNFPTEARLQYLPGLTDEISCLLDYQRQFNEISRSQLTQGLTLRVIFDNYLLRSKVGFGEFSKLSMSNIQECVSIPDGTMTGHRQPANAQSLLTDLSTSDTSLTTLLQMLGIEKTDPMFVFIHNKGNEIRMRIVSIDECFDVQVFIQNCSMNNFKKQKAIHAKSVSTSIAFSKSKYPQIIIHNNDRGDVCSSTVVLSSKDVEPERFMRSPNHPKRNICIGIQFLPFKILCQVREYGLPPFPPENARHILSNVTLSPNKELAGKSRNTITDVSSLQLKTPITHATNKMTAMKPADYRTCSKADKSDTGEEKYYEKPAVPPFINVLPGSDQTSDSCVIECGAHPKRTGKNTSKEKDICLENSSNHTDLHKHLQFSNTEPKFDHMVDSSSEFTPQNKRQKGFHQSNESSRQQQRERGQKVHITSLGKPLASATDHDNYNTELTTSEVKLKHNREADFQYGSSMQLSRRGNAHGDLVDNAILNGGQIDRYAQNIPTPDAGIIDNAIRNCSRVFENDIRDDYGANESGNMNRVIPVTTEERPIQLCSRTVHSFEIGIRSEASSIFAIRPMEPETWEICTSVSTRKPTPDDNRICYKLGVALPAAGVASGHIFLTNTCAIDGFLLMVFIDLHFDPYLRDKFRRSTNEFHKICFKIWTYFQKREFNAGKIAWCLYAKVIKMNTRRDDLTGTENKMVFAGFNQNRISVEEKCSDADCAFSHATTTQELYDVLTVHREDGESLPDTIKKKIGKFICCPIGSCKTKLGNGERCNGTRIRNVVTLPDILPINLYFLKNEKGQKPYSSCDIPDTIETNGETYDLKLIRFYKNGHFTGKLRVKEDWTYYDNTDARLCYFDKDPDFSQLSSCYYRLRCRH